MSQLSFPVEILYGLFWLPMPAWLDAGNSGGGAVEEGARESLIGIGIGGGAKILARGGKHGQDDHMTKRRCDKSNPQAKKPRRPSLKERSAKLFAKVVSEGIPAEQIIAIMKKQNREGRTVA